MSATKSQTLRFFFVIIILFVILSGLIWRLVDLNILDRNFLLKQSQARILRKMIIPSYRGMIVDRTGEPLAISTPVDSVWVNPQSFHPTFDQVNRLAQFLGIPDQQIQAAHQGQNQNREFVYLKRRIPPPQADKIKALNIPGVFFQREYQRFYPEGEIAAQVIGITNVDDQGQEGLELAYNRWLAGTPGAKEVLKDRLGHIISDIALLKKPQEGHDLILSLDHRVQYAAYVALKEAFQQYQADAGSIVVLNAKTGEILAMVNQPSYNPNRRPGQHDDGSRNRAVTDVYEPGSVIKSFNIALALESGKYTPNSVIDTSPGWMVISGYTIKDEHDDGVLNLTQVLQKSSNIGAAKILRSLSPNDYWKLLTSVGFGQKTDSGFPGEVSGSVVPQSQWYPSVLTTLAYGYGLSVTALQLAQAYLVFADHGIKLPVTFLKSTQPLSMGVQVITPKTAATMLEMLKAVVDGGTGVRAGVEGYQVAGKTGTAYIANGRGYDRHRYMSSFVGIAPVTDPQIVVAVVLRDPKHQHMGAYVAAPVFSKVMSQALRILDIPPDNLPATNSPNSPAVAIIPLGNSSP